MVLTSKENAVPASLVRARSVSSRVAKVVRDSKRRRTRFNAVSHSRKAAVVKQRVRSLRVTLKHADPDPSPDPVPEPSTVRQTVTLTNTLPRPQYKEIPRQALANVDPQLADADLGYIRDRLYELGPHLLRDIASVRATAPKQGPLPKELTILAHDVIPSMMLAVWGPSADAAKTVTLWPAHALVFAVSCANLPGLPPSTSLVPPPDAGTDSDPIQISVPVLPLSLPAPAEFAPLFAFLYNGNPNILFRSLLPGEKVPENLYKECFHPAHRAAFSRHLAETYTVHKLLSHVRSIKGVYQNTVVLGIFNQDLWQCLDVAWDVILTALSLATAPMQLRT